MRCLLLASGSIALLHVAVASADELAKPKNAQTIVEDFFKQSEGAGPVYYEAVASVSPSPEPKGLERVWMNGAYVRVESELSDGTKGLWIFHPGIAYEYDAKRDQFVKWQRDLPMFQLHVGTPSIDLATAKIVGAETLEEKQTVIVEFASPVPMDAISGTARIWYWKDKGFPLKVEVTFRGGEQMMAKAIKMFRGFRFEPFAGSLFEVPPDKVVERHNFG